MGNGIVGLRGYQQGGLVAEKLTQAAAREEERRIHDRMMRAGQGDSRGWYPEEQKSGLLGWLKERFYPESWAQRDQQAIDDYAARGNPDRMRSPKTGWGHQYGPGGPPPLPRKVGRASGGIVGLRGYQQGGLADPPPMTITAEGVPITLDAPERGFRRFTPERILRNMMGGLGGLGVWEMVRDRMARGIENADFLPLNIATLGVLKALPEGVREWMADDYDERKLTADDLPGNVHDFARMIAAQAITKAGPDADLNRGVSGTPIPYPTQEFAAEHFDPSLMDRLAGRIVGTDRDVGEMTRDQRNEAIGFTDPSGWGATFGQGTMFEDPEGDIHFIDRYNYPNMTAGQVPGREWDTDTQFSDYARGLGPHEAEQFRQDVAAFMGEEGEPLSRRGTNVLRHYMSEFGSTETDPTEGRSWDINLGPREELLAAYAAANDPQPSRVTRGLGWLRDFFDRDRGVQVAETRDRPVDEPDVLTNLNARLAAQRNIQPTNVLPQHQYQQGGPVDPPFGPLTREAYLESLKNKLRTFPAHYDEAGIYIGSGIEITPYTHPWTEAERASAGALYAQRERRASDMIERERASAKKKLRLIPRGGKGIGAFLGALGMGLGTAVDLAASPTGLGSGDVPREGPFTDEDRMRSYEDLMSLGRELGVGQHHPSILQLSREINEPSIRSSYPSGPSIRSSYPMRRMGR